LHLSTLLLAFLAAPATSTPNTGTAPRDLERSHALAKAELGAVGGIVIPEHQDGAPSRMRSFEGAALRAVLSTHESDHDDPAVLLSLQAKLWSEAALEPARSAWGTLLERAIVRAKLLEKLRGPVHQLRRAFRDAKFDDGNGVYRGVDIGRCLIASSRASGDDNNVGISLKNLGYRRLSTLKTLCEQALQLELSERRFPRALGSGKLRAAVAKAYRQFAPSEQVLKISVPGGWKSREGSRSLKASVGVEFPSEEHGFSCGIIEQRLSQINQAQGRGPTTCCEISKTSPIDCRRLRNQGG